MDFDRAFGWVELARYIAAAKIHRHHVYPGGESYHRSPTNGRRICEASRRGGVGVNRMQFFSVPKTEWQAPRQIAWDLSS